MKKILRIASLITLLIVVAIYLFVPQYMVGLIENYSPYSHEMVFSDSSMCQKFGIAGNKGPSDYGAQDYEEYQFYSIYDSTKLNGWYIKSKNGSNSTIVMVHGRTSNRLKTMKYLELFRTTGLDTLYNIFIPDLRNSGKSAPSKTYMGYKFAEDVVSSLLFLQKGPSQEHFILYGFSMGAMASFTSLGRSDLSAIIKHEGLSIDKLVMDSPLVNVQETLRLNSNEMGMPNIIFNRAYHLFSKDINNYADSLSMSAQLKGYPDVPLLLLQSKDDETTPYQIFMKEYGQLKQSSNIELHTFEGVGHVRIYQEPRYKEGYTKIVNDFIRGQSSKGEF